MFKFIHADLANPPKLINLHLVKCIHLQANSDSSGPAYIFFDEIAVKFDNAKDADTIYKTLLEQINFGD